MFTGIVETQSKVLEVKPQGEGVVLSVECPDTFDDLNIGDSISINGVCLTIESFSISQISFSVVNKTLETTLWKDQLKPGISVNLERSMKYGDRVHGHLVSGHVDGVAEVVSVTKDSLAYELVFEFSDVVSPFIWNKGGISINGVSLTVQNFSSSKLSVAIIPETFRRTNLGQLVVGDKVTYELDYWAKAYMHYLEVQDLKKPPIYKDKNKDLKETPF